MTTLSDNFTLQINNKSGDTIFKIDNEGNIFYKLNGELKVFEEEKELSLILVNCISGITRIKFSNKEDIYLKVIKNWREGKIDLILD